MVYPDEALFKAELNAMVVERGSSWIIRSVRVIDGLRMLT